MAADTRAHRDPLGSRWRLAGWGAAVALLVAPGIAMQFTDEVNWNVADFFFAGALVLAVGIALELAVRRTANRAYRTAVAIALAAGFVLVWANAAVGIIGSEDHPANRMYDAVLAVGVVGALVARFRPQGMAVALAATAFAQVLAGAVAWVSGWGAPVPITLVFGAMWLASAWLFRKAARQPA